MNSKSSQAVEDRTVSGRQPLSMNRAASYVFFALLLVAAVVVIVTTIADSPADTTVGSAAPYTAARTTWADMRESVYRVDVPQKSDYYAGRTGVPYLGKLRTNWSEMRESVYRVDVPTKSVYVSGGSGASSD